MLIGILKTGRLPPDLEGAQPSYPAMIRAALGAHYEYRELDAQRGELPQLNSPIQAYVITGSASSVYDSQPWIAALKSWLQVLDPATPLVGICFGHQIMAEAYGGKVEKSPRGWGLGLHEYAVKSRESWMSEVRHFVIPAAHYDQIARVPPDSQIIAASDFCPYAALSYRDRHAMSFQGHPEFDLDFAALVIKRCLQKGAIGAAQAESARESLQRADDRNRVRAWIRAFLEGRA